MKSTLIIEGWSDHKQIISVFPTEFEFIVTNGTKMNNRIRQQIEESLESGSDTHILSDPDSSGDQLAGMIWREYPELHRIPVDFEEASYFTGRRIKSGVEYCSYNYIRQLLGGYINE